MNQFRSWILGKSPVGEFDQHATFPNYDPKESKSLQSQINKTDYPPSVHLDLISSRNVSKDGSNQLGLQQSQEKTNSYLWNSFSKIVPLAPGDCLECKIVGIGVMMLSGFIILASAATSRKRNLYTRGANKIIYYTLCGSLFLGFETIAACRLFDWGPFNKKNT
ncbi:uncharacterized protein LOC131949627 [Physella acuta]|uniref:uncharacterized protein LOC131949627 n=1 Tax=Physella acuta TaxID=109671 RepID=UPI0027DBC382|nr:uncharacterized protein LOC131949627 [Physella acuta]